MVRWVCLLCFISFRVVAVAGFGRLMVGVDLAARVELVMFG